ncbi:hypothetical protein SNOG_10961 [Parastagonospora nodorum SN15]|uniref:Heterokaryon incompatibility domain-containing protein n=1 Tax=Phaeosphaeria nodorum (strain SN15 / ATCC MYA-4574 / FGSC 10173) TaxID=321614 RepID=Q0UBA3_PHANO|nr:hypothetical protein SNOG_10961 [Parastagonospora nodorum SN15]EAT81460.1 hypothetical protein SNOG_10961 [Parastagonospora nodorum SN15]
MATGSGQTPDRDVIGSYVEEEQKIISRPGPYRYQTLDSKSNEIRLLRIPKKTTNPSTPLQYTLFHTSLKDSSNFLALSYCWGSHTLSHTMTINNHSMPITESLATALASLQSQSHDILLWADAICINQHDPIEKTSQVQLMRDIYQTASQVIIWLGPATPDTYYTVREMRKLGDELIGLGLWDLSSEELLRWDEDGDGESSAATKQAISKMRDQHLKMARRDEYPFWWIMSNLGETLYFRIFSSRSHPDVHGDVQAFWKDNWLTNMLSDALPTTLIGIRRKYLVSGGHDLRTLLDRVIVKDSKSQRIDATDPRDRVFALLGIANDEAAKEIVADYTLSWSADLRKPWSVWHTTSRLYAASGPSKLLLSPIQDLFFPYLTLPSLFIDTIASLGHTFTPGLDDQISWPSLRPYFADISLFLAQSTRYTAQEKEEAEWRIPVGDTEVAETNSQMVRATPNSHMKAGHAVAKAMASETGAVDELVKENFLAFACYRCQMGRMYDSQLYAWDYGWGSHAQQPKYGGHIFDILPLLSKMSYLKSNTAPELHLARPLNQVQCKAIEPHERGSQASRPLAT